MRDSSAEVEHILSAENEAGTAPEDRSFRPDIEGLRAVAVGFVILNHSLGVGFRVATSASTCSSSSRAS